MSNPRNCLEAANELAAVARDGITAHTEKLAVYAECANGEDPKPCTIILNEEVTS